MKAISDNYKDMTGIVATARASLPEIEVDYDSFESHIHQFINRSDPQSIARLEIVDLYLCFACLSGNEQALVIFEDEYTPLIRRNIAKLNLSESAMEEIVQRFRFKLFVKLEGKEPKLASYNGSSKLSSWLRVVALREALDFVKSRENKDLPLDDAALADQIAPCDQEIQLIRKQYRNAFETVLKDTLRDLNQKDRNLLRASALDKLTIDEIGRLYRVHRATAARWLAGIRVRLKEGIKERLKTNLSLNTYEYEKIASVLNSQLSLSLSRILIHSTLKSSKGGATNPSRLVSVLRQN